ncbi:NUDIX domain-containing protein [Candidatus Dojkabacteria bacterium]|nr:NUDIX domain-containing protein [Candidatus Dojkabacteria bacterium]
MKQKIWCINSEKLFSKGKWNGLKRDDLDYYYKLLNTEGEFRERGLLENDPAFKQVIGQVLLQVGNKFLIHRVNSYGGEKRAHGLWPILVGGHIEEQDLNDRKDIVTSAIDREFEEEVNYGGKIIRKDFLGIVYIEDENPVNHVHVGLVYRFVGDVEDVKPVEKEISDMRFVERGYIEENIEKLTYWSREIVPLLA